MKKKNILCFVSHPDDGAIGIGGTLAKYARGKNKIVEVIFSYGELSHLRKSVIIRKRISEAKKSAKILGYKTIIFFGLPDGSIGKEIDRVKNKIITLIKKYKPIKIFTHSQSDPLPDHKAVNKAVINILDEISSKIDVYGFDVWNITNPKEADTPRMYVDVSDTFNNKIKALKVYKSQMHVMLQLIPSVYARAKLHGQHIGCKYAERFYKIR